LETQEELSKEMLEELSEELNVVLEEKLCITCGITWPLATGFYDDKKSKDGKFGACKICRDAYTRSNEKRRASEPLSPRAEATRKLYAARFHVIKEAGLSVDVGGANRGDVAYSEKIDDLLERCNLGEDRAMSTRNKPASETIITFDINRFKGGRKVQKARPA